MTIFVRNQWYVGAWSSEVGREPLGRMLCGEPVMLYRKEAGAAVALEDACPHRMLPLSMGFMEGDAVRCRYHGMLLDPQGRCLEMPGGAAPSPSIRGRVYPVEERYGFVWVWIGEAELADPALLPDLWMNEAEGWRVGGGYYAVACDYRLMIDNLMDLTHETYVHASSIGQKELHDFASTTRLEAGRVVTERWMPEVIPPPLYRQQLGGYDGPVDRWQICNFLPPSGVVIDVGVARPERGVTLLDHDNADIRNFVLDFITPATATTCHYFWGSARGGGVNKETFDRIIAAQGVVFLEDVAVLEAQQRSIDLLGDRKLRAFAGDAGGVQARAILHQLASGQDAGTVTAEHV